MSSDRSTEIAVGVAGWSYPDWEGYVYEPGVKDKLRFVAGFVDMIEINSTFYRPPDARTAASWARRVADLPGFFFSAKLHRDMTHEGRFSTQSAEAFRHGLEPLSRVGRLRHLLAQFRYDFADSPESRDLLKALSEAFAEMATLVIEVRHRSWQQPEALDFLKGLGVTVANLDYPTGRMSFTLPICTVGEHGYFRLHGRNRAAWFDREAGRDETYNYLYNATELRELEQRARRLAPHFRSLTIVANNHYQGKELVNALQLKALLTGQKVRVPPALARRYPELREIAAGEEAGLF